MSTVPCSPFDLLEEDNQTFYGAADTDVYYIYHGKYLMKLVISF